MTGPDAPITGPIETIAKGPRQGAYVALAAAAVGSVLAIVGFFVAINAALDGGGSGAGTELAVTITGLVFDLVAIVLALVMLVRGAPKVVPWLAIGVAFGPEILVAVLEVLVRR